MPSYRCLKCGQVAVISGKNMEVQLPRKPSQRFPLHGDCELAKAADTLDYSKLELIE